MKWLKKQKNKVQSISNNENHEFDECISFLNEIAFTVMFLVMSISFIAIWTVISSSNLEITIKHTIFKFY